MIEPPPGRAAKLLPAAVGLVALVLVIGGLAGGGPSGGLLMAGVVALLLGLGALIAGGARWAFIASRATAGIVAAGGVAATNVAGATLPASTHLAPVAARATSSIAAQSPPADESAIAATESSLAAAEGTETSGVGNAASADALSDGSAATAISRAAVSARTSALAPLAAVPVKGRAPLTGYSRNQFGDGWVDTDHNGSDTRNDVLARDLTGDTFKPGTHDCVVLTGTLADPYSGRTIAFTRGVTTSAAVQVDHVVALAGAWQTGAQGWDPTKRTAFANDPRELLAVDGPLNQQKGDGDAATWLPPNTAYRCAYVARQVAVKVVYGLWMTQAEKDASATILATCSSLPLPDGVVANVPLPTRQAVPPPAAAPVPSHASAAAPAPPPAPAPANTVHAGSFCAPAGATGVTSIGKPMVCRTSATDSRNRWRSP